ncbi:Abi family protein [Tsukamurella soli]
MQLAAGYLELLSVAEVVLRNALNEQLRDWCRDRSGTDVWLTSDDPLPFPLDKLFTSVREGAMARATDAKTVRDTTPTHDRCGVPLTEGDVLSQVTFGQWHNLFPYTQGQATDPTTNSYRAQMWSEALRDVFPAGVNPDDVRWLLYRLTYFRNRVAHHECIISAPLPPNRRHPLRSRLRDIFTLLRWLDPDVHEWTTGSNRVTALLAAGASVR